MIASVFIGTSVDGFIARPDGALDFLPADGGEPHGYSDFFSSIDALVIGRKTFETVLAFPEWPYADKPVIVLSTQKLDLSRLSGRPVEQMTGTVEQVTTELTLRGFQHVYIDGGITVQNFLRAGLIQRLIITRVPVLIGQGIPLFSSLPHDVKLEHVSTQSYRSGLVKTEYRILNGQ